ncbi:peptidase A24A prepilin type IV [Xanthobacter versatilis]|uniref:Peptidase A24A prepilin type IV n=1 Tax=Xanthobacter autotrophicus (strain ATCC BAA-1158 / Py2) TaxID=78245 RepID=A7IBZ7_XANP2|nr:peptidase A24A prepilin type IV [Xanthobacter autotrophicus Py2]
MWLAELLLLGLYPTALCTCIGTDIARRIIPNTVIAALLIGFATLAILTPLPDLSLRLLVAVAVTALGFSLFAENVVGAGDAKLAGVLMLWTEPAQLPLFVLACGLIGGVLTLAALAMHRPADRLVGTIAVPGQTIPYGVALAGAGLLLHPYSSLLGAG